MASSAYIDNKSQKSYQRETPLEAPNPDNYTWWDAGVLTFRGDNFRRNAAFGTAEIANDQMNVIWKKELGHLATADSGTLYGVGWTGQPAIVKWSKEVRNVMNLKEEKKSVSALREVIFSAQDGKVYFLDLTDVYMRAYSEQHLLPSGFSNTAPARGHLNAVGHRLIAETVYDTITAWEG